MTAPLLASGAAAELRQLARSGAADRYAAALFAPAPVQGDLIALAAFEAEINAIAERVHEPLLGELRLQWWRDEIGRIDNGEAAGHPVLEAMSGTSMRHRLPGGLLLAMIDAVGQLISAEPIADDTAFRALLAKAGASPVLLAGRCLGGSVDGSLRQALTAAGIAIGLDRLVGELPRHFARGRIPLPRTLVAAAGVEPHDLIAGRSTAATARLAADLESLVAAASATALDNVRSLPAAVRPAVLPLALVSTYSRHRQRLGAASLTTGVRLSPLNRLIRLAIVSRTGRFG